MFGRPKLCKSVTQMLEAARKMRSADVVNAERMAIEFGVKAKGRDLTLGDLNDWQLLQALFIETQWALAQQGREMQLLSSVSKLNRETRRRIARDASR